MTNHTVIGIDLAKTVFHIVVLSTKGQVTLKKKMSRTQLKRYFSNLSSTKIAMEACSSSHYFGRLFQELGHDVVLLPAQHVKGYLRGQKNDYNDALAIAEACLHGSIRPIVIKTAEQQSKQGFHRMRKQVSDDRKRLLVQLRGLLSEFGIVLARGASKVRSSLPDIIQDAENHLPDEFRVLLSRQYDRLVQLDDELSWYDDQLKRQSQQDEVCRRLLEVPGVGPVVSSALRYWFAEGQQFRRGREASAALGVVPRQHSSGGKVRLGRISKRGDRYVRTVLIHGARSVVRLVGNKTDPLSVWLRQLLQRRGFNKTVVALANKIVRIAWVIVARGERYDPRRMRPAYC